MLAYLFWHRPSAGVERDGYERALAAFHAALAAHPPEGFGGSAAYRLAEAPWLRGEGDAYEDWYRVADWAALGRLNEAAVSGPRAEPHDAVAHAAGPGAGGVYRLVEGSPEPPARPHHTWLHALPADPEAPTWQRQLVLGPAPEFVLVSERPLALPGAAHESEPVPVVRA
jgi:hypothetical protein